MNAATSVKRTPAEMAVSVLSALIAEPRHEFALAKACNVDPKKQIVGKYVRALRDKGHAYVAHYRNGRTPVYAFSAVPFACKDAPRPGDTT